VQYWATDRLTLEGGVGLGFWRTAGDDENGLGLILGIGAVVFKNGGHNLMVGAEYAPTADQREPREADTRMGTVRGD
jgi:hypothetical protein